MSLLTTFAQKAFQSARSTIGGENINVNGGGNVSAVLNEITDSKDYGDAGFVPMTTFQAVVDSVEFTAIYTASLRSYIGATINSRTRKFRLVDIVAGRTFLTLKLESIHKA